MIRISLLSRIFCGAQRDFTPIFQKHANLPVKLGERYYIFVVYSTATATQSQKNSKFIVLHSFRFYFLALLWREKSYLQWNNTILLDGCFLCDTCEHFPHFLGGCVAKIFHIFISTAQTSRISLLKLYRSGNLETT